MKKLSDDNLVSIFKKNRNDLVVLKNAVAAAINEIYDNFDGTVVTTIKYDESTKTLIFSSKSTSATASEEPNES